MWGVIRRVKNLHYYYCALASTCNRLESLNFTRVCIQNEFLNFIPNENNLSLVSFHPTRDSVRFKSTGKKKSYSNVGSDNESSDEEDMYEEGNFDVDGGKIKKLFLKSMRIDNVLKAGFGISTRKMEECIFSNKLRLNGKPITKKSLEIRTGDVLEMFAESTDGEVSSKSIGKFVVKKVEPVMNVLMYNVYISFHKN